MSIEVQLIMADAFHHYMPQLVDLLVDGVQSGASISFIEPFTDDNALQFWQNNVYPNLVSGERLLLVAQKDNKLAGAVQLIVGMPPNQAHRAEIAKLIVHTSQRRHGIGRLLMATALQQAESMAKTLVTLDTRTGDPSQKLYASLGFEIAGIIPDFALDPDGQKLSGTTYMYKKL